MARDATRVRKVPTLTAFDPAHVLPYRNMIERFLNGRLSVAEFEASYLRTFKDDATAWPEPIYRILNEVFLDVDAYNPYPEGRDEWDIDEAELRGRVERSLATLRGAL